MMPVTDRIRILIIQANPPGTIQLGSSDEIRNVQQALRQSGARDLFAVAIAPAAQINDILPALGDHQPHILHFTGHGDGQGGIILHAPDHPDGLVLSAANLTRQIKIHQAEAKTKLQLVLLVGCDTAAAAQGLTAHVACAIGLSDAISDSAALHLTAPFYHALGEGYSIGNALDAALVALDSHPQYTADAAMVQRYAAPGVDPATLRPQAWLSTRSPLPLAYLQALFDQLWATVLLADIQRDRHDQAQLLDLYVPLPVDFTIVVKTEGGEIVDWWAKINEIDDERRLAYEESSADGEPGAADLLAQRGKVRRWSNLGVEEPALTQIVAGIQQKITARAADGQETKDGEHIWYMEAHDAATVQPRFVLRGDPGSGKSSFLRHLALCLAGELRRRAGDQHVPAKANLAALRDWLLDAYVPLYVEMRTLVNTVFSTLPTDDSQPVARPTAETLWTYVAQAPRIAPYTEDLRRMAETGELILLLDGLDEVPQGDRRSRREQIQSFVYALVQRYPDLRIVLTSRPNAYQPAKWALHGFGYATLEPLHFERLRELALALFTTAAVAAAERAATDFVQALRDHRHLDPQLYANPLLFTLLAALWLTNPTRRLPETQAELYRAAVDLLLDWWTRRRLPDQSVVEWLGLAPEALRPLLETLAYTVHASEEANAPHDVQANAAQRDPTTFSIETLFLILYRNHYHRHLDEISDYLTQKAGILISTEPEQFRFSHRSFQEHLAACALISPAPTNRQPPIDPKRHFPHGLLAHIHSAPLLWENVAHLAADELSLTRQPELWTLLHGLCQPYLQRGAEGASALVALKIADRHRLFAEISPGDMQAFLLEPLRQTALKLLTDQETFPAPAERNLAGELLGRRPEHDTRPGVGCRRDGLPDIDWVEIPEADEQGRREFIYQQSERRTEPTFWMARYPVTYGQFQAFLDAEDGFYNPLWWEGLAAPEDEKAKPREQAFKFWNHPRENVNWHDAIAFCRWLTAKAKAQPALLPPALRGRTDWRITLPTEWQWEKAARGPSIGSGTGRRYPWGEKYVSGYANIDETGRKDGPHYLQKTSAVGMYPPNKSPFGVVDMSGNVWEYCLNEYSNPDRTQETGNANRVVRGGSWTSIRSLRPCSAAASGLLVAALGFG